MLLLCVVSMFCAILHDNEHYSDDNTKLNGNIYLYCIKDSYHVYVKWIALIHMILRQKQLCFCVSVHERH